jgi:hypothetical protein
MLVAEKDDGRGRRVINGIFQAGAVLDVAVDNDAERGLLGMALHPAFPATPFRVPLLHGERRRWRHGRIPDAARQPCLPLRVERKRPGVAVAH